MSETGSNPFDEAPGTGEPGHAPVNGAAGTPEPGELEAEEEESRAPHRVVGTPPPAQARVLLATDEGPGRPGAAGPGGQAEAPQGKGAERTVATLFIIAMIAGIAFIAFYIGIPLPSIVAVSHSNLALGLTLSIALMALGVGATIWVRSLMPHVEVVEARKPLASPEQDRQEFAETFAEGADASGFVRRPLLRRTLIAATVPLAVAPVVLLRDMGPLPGTYLRHTVWRAGMRLLVAGPNRPLRPADFASPGSMITVVPDGYQDNQDALALAATIIIKFAPGELQFPETVKNWTVDNIVAYSKICTHVGCPVALYEQTTHHILCPCHQSTFDATRGAKVIFGPAARALPQLPLTTDAEGYLVAKSDYTQPVGPSFWERG